MNTMISESAGALPENLSLNLGIMRKGHRAIPMSQMNLAYSVS